jgi:hypothetical protein
MRHRQDARVGAYEGGFVALARGHNATI